MEGTPRKMSVLEAESRIPRVFADFRQEAAEHGMHDRDMDLCEKYMTQALEHGLEACKSG